MMHEAQMARERDLDCWFVTLTFAPEHCPADLSVSVEVHQRFMKRYRKAFGRARFFMCGEYGDEFGRPHYHYIIFGTTIPDLVVDGVCAGGDQFFRSEKLAALWPHGFVRIDRVTQASCDYVARYTIKKVNGKLAAEHYRRQSLDVDTGEVCTWQVHPEFIQCSRRPGIGGAWYAKYQRDCFPSDFVVVDGRRRAVPQAYKRKLVAEGEASGKLANPATELRAKRKKAARRPSVVANNTPARLAVRAESRMLKHRRLLRELDARG
jgi:hypothetical protein